MVGNLQSKDVQDKDHAVRQIGIWMYQKSAILQDFVAQGRPVSKLNEQTSQVKAYLAFFTAVSLGDKFFAFMMTCSATKKHFSA